MRTRLRIGTSLQSQRRDRAYQLGTVSRPNDSLANHWMLAGHPTSTSKTQNYTLITQESIGFSAIQFAKRNTAGHVAEFR
ncbi:MAG: hypothetical protein GY906_04285 [bacterium]|nr:hypothetical protein [bacterium]